MKRYATLYERLVANTRLANPDNPDSCWVWTGSRRAGYPCLCVRVRGRRTPRTVGAHRAMLEEVLDAWFPFDEAGHLCYNTLCINPNHLEVQSPWFNLSDRRGYKPTDGRMIPVLYPREEPLQYPEQEQAPHVRPHQLRAA